MLKIMLDPGHGGADPGAMANGLREAELNLAVAKEARNSLAKLLPNAEIRLTRETNESLQKDARLSRISAFNPDIFISIHHDAFNDIVPHGVDVFYANNDLDGLSVAGLIGEQVEASGLNWRGAKVRLNSMGQDYYYIIREVKARGRITLLYEGLFLTNKGDASLLKANGVGLQAKAIAEAIARHARATGGASPVLYVEGVDKVIGLLQVNDRTYAPVREFLEAVGYDVHWSQQTRTVTAKRRK